VSSWYWDRFATCIDPDWVVLMPFGPRAAVRTVLGAVVRTGGHGRTAPSPVVSLIPDYGGFTALVQAVGARHVQLPLIWVNIPVRDTSSGGGQYRTHPRLPVAEVAEHARHGIIAVLLSSPHNPTGLVWEEGEIRALAQAAALGGGILLSDEVHSDLVHPGEVHTPAVRAAGDLAD
jgi:cystathionine beta-lyase